MWLTAQRGEIVSRQASFSSDRLFVHRNPGIELRTYELSVREKFSRKRCQKRVAAFLCCGIWVTGIGMEWKWLEQVWRWSLGKKIQITLFKYHLTSWQVRRWSRYIPLVAIATKPEKGLAVVSHTHWLAHIPRSTRHFAALIDSPLHSQC